MLFAEVPADEGKEQEQGIYLREEEQGGASVACA